MAPSFLFLKHIKFMDCRSNNCLNYIIMVNFYITEGDDGDGPEDSVHRVTGRGGALTGRGTEELL